MDDFWEMYRAVSPEIFDQRFNALCQKYSGAADYLRSNLYPCRDRWAWAWVSTVFTAGIRTNGRVEAENRVNKLFGGPKVSGYQLFQRLLGRLDEQTQGEQIGVREVGQAAHVCESQANFLPYYYRPLAVIIRRYGRIPLLGPSISLKNMPMDSRFIPVLRKWRSRLITPSSYFNCLMG